MLTGHNNNNNKTTIKSRYLFKNQRCVSGERLIWPSLEEPSHWRSKRSAVIDVLALPGSATLTTLGAGAETRLGGGERPTAAGRRSLRVNQATQISLLPAFVGQAAGE